MFPYCYMVMSNLCLSSTVKLNSPL
jgi:hypothetical protein